jgi:hypothetical protein
MRNLLTITFILFTTLVYSQNFRTAKLNDKPVNMQVYISLSSIIIDEVEFKLTSQDWTINSLMDKLEIKGVEYIFNKEEDKHTLIYANKVYTLIQ